MAMTKVIDTYDIYGLLKNGEELINDCHVMELHDIAHKQLCVGNSFLN